MESSLKGLQGERSFEVGLRGLGQLRFAQTGHEELKVRPRGGNILGNLVAGMCSAYECG